MIIINKNESGQVQVYSPDNTETLFPNEMTASEVAGEVSTLDTALTAMYTALNAVIGDTYYKSGDTISTSSADMTTVFFCSAIITNGGKSIQLSIPMPKSLKNITTATFTKFVGYLRKPEGGYILYETDFATATGYTLTAKINKTMNCINVDILSANSIGTNNIPLAGTIDMELTLS